MDIMTARRIKQLRSGGMTQTDVAKELHINRRSVIRCEQRGFRATEGKLRIADRHSSLVRCGDTGCYRSQVLSWNELQITNKNHESLSYYEFVGTDGGIHDMTPEELLILEEELNEQEEADDSVEP